MVHWLQQYTLNTDEKALNMMQSIEQTLCNTQSSVFMDVKEVIVKIIKKRENVNNTIFSFRTRFSAFSLTYWYIIIHAKYDLLSANGLKFEKS